MLVELHIDRIPYTRKPSNPGRITKDVIKEVSKVNPKELAEALSSGHSVVLSTMNGSRSNLNMVQQQILMLDFDNKDTNKQKTQGMFYTSLNDILANEFIMEHASFIYTTFNHKEGWDKFRVVFILDKPLTDHKQVTEVYKWLQERFPNADKQVKDAARVFYGGRESIEINFDNRLSIPEEIFNREPNKQPKKVRRSKPVKVLKSDKPNWLLIKEGNSEELKERFSNHSIKLPSKVSAVNHLKSLNLYEILGVEGNPFLDIFHKELNPSASCFQHESTGNWLYHCFSDNEEWNGDIIRIIERLQNTSYMKAVNFAIEVFNIKIVMTEQIREIREQVDLFNNMLANAEELKLMYPNINTVFWRWRKEIYMLLNIFKDNIYEDYEGNVRCLTWMSTRTLASKVFGDPDKFRRIAEILNILVYTKWIEKLDVSKIPEALLMQIKASQIDKGYSKRSNVFELLYLDEGFFEELDDQCGIMKNNGWTKKGMSEGYLIRTEGKEEAKRVYVQGGRKITKKDEAITGDIHKITLELIEKQGYTTESQVLKRLRRKWKSQSYGEFKIKQCISEMLDSYNIKRVTLTKKLKEHLGIDPSSKGNPKVLIMEYVETK